MLIGTHHLMLLPTFPCILIFGLSCFTERESYNFPFLQANTTFPNTFFHTIDIKELNIKVDEEKTLKKVNIKLKRQFRTHVLYAASGKIW